MLCDTLGRPLRFLLAPGQSHDILAAPALLAGFKSQAVLADRAYDTNALRGLIAGMGAQAVIPSKTAAGFLQALIEAVPYQIHTVLTDNGIQFGDAIQHRSGPTARWRVHMFDRVCLANGIEHRFTRPNHPWTNGQVERMNRTLKKATVRRYHYVTHQQLEAHLTAFLDAYNFAKRLKTLNGLTPYEAICTAWTAEPQDSYAIQHTSLRD